MLDQAITDWVAPSLVAGLPELPTSTRGIAKAAERGEIVRRKRKTGKGWEYDTRSLPDEAREALSSRLEQGTAESPTPRTAEEFEAWVSERRLRLSAKDLQDPKVLAKLDCARRLAAIAPYEGRTRLLAALAAQYGKTPITIRRWVDEVASWAVRSKTAQLQLEQTSVELPKSRAFADEAVAFGMHWYANHLASGRRAAWAKTVTQAREQGWKHGDYTSFTRLVRQIPDRVWEWIRKGPVGFELGAVPKIIRAWLSVPVYDVLCGDQNILDYETIDPETGEIVVPECYVWMDCTSRAWTGVWPAFGHYNKYTVGYSLREANRLALASEVYTDWGKPEVSKYSEQVVRGLSGHIGVGGWEDYAARYAPRDLVDHRKAHPGVPWMKPIENQFNVLKRDLLDRDTPGFRQRQGGAWENKTRMSELASARKRKILMSTDEFYEQLIDVVVTHNKKACRVAETSQPLIPAHVLYQGLAEQQRPVYDDLTLDTLFLPRFVRKVRQSMVTIQVAKWDKRTYYAPALSMVSKAEGVQVAVDPFDPDRPAVISTLRGDFMALAEPWKVQNPTDTDEWSRKIKRQAQLMKWWRGQVRRVRDGFGMDTPVVRKVSDATRAAMAAAKTEALQDEVKPAASRADEKIIELFGEKRAG